MLGALVWLGCAGVMGIIAVTWIGIATEPPHENNMAGVVWVMLGPAVPVGLGVAAAMLYRSWDRLVAASPRVARAAAASIPAVGVTFLAGLIFPFVLPVAILMAVALLAHVMAMIAATFCVSRRD